MSPLSPRFYPIRAVLLEPRPERCAAPAAKVVSQKILFSTRQARALILFAPRRGEDAVEGLTPKCLWEKGAFNSIPLVSDLLNGIECKCLLGAEEVGAFPELKGVPRSRLSWNCAAASGEAIRHVAPAATLLARW